jgi:predicted membrane protein
MDHSGYVYPNEHVEWGLTIVTYPFLTGIVAGSFYVAMLYFLYKNKSLAPVGRLSLLVSLSFLAFATAPLMLHLGRPDRALLIMIRPNLQSAMSGFGYIYSLYAAILCMMIWFVYRPLLVDRSRTASTTIGRLFYSVLALGVREITEKARRIDRKIIIILARVGIPVACVLTGYVGFIFGSIKANEWWSTPLRPVVFLMSAVVSGIAMVILVYYLASLLRRKPIDPLCVNALTQYLWRCLLITVVLELLELGTSWYEHGEHWPMLQELMADRLRITFIWGQLIVGTGVSLLLLAVAALFPVGQWLQRWLAGLASVLVLMQVICMRWNVVIGGQLLSKSGRGFHEYHMEWLGREGLLAAIGVFVAPFVFLFVLYRILPPYAQNGGADTSSQDGAVEAGVAETAQA